MDEIGLVGYQDHQPIDMTGRPGGVWHRQLIELIDDLGHCLTSDDDHDSCLTMRICARWPSPNPGQDISLNRPC